MTDFRTPHAQRTSPVEGGAPRRHGVVAVVLRDERFLVIRRSQIVSAPGMLCFPGGGIEPGEAEADAVVREMLEELDCAVRPIRRVWASVTRWNVALAWWQVTLQGDDALAGVAEPWRLNLAEVAEAYWLTATEMDKRSDLLASNREFLAEWRRGTFELDS